MKKIILITTTIFSLLVLTACGGTKTTKDVIFKGVTISYENYDDAKDYTKEEYYLNRNTDYNINIYFENTKELDIESLKLSDQVFTKEDFSEDSTSEKIIIPMNTMNNTGVFNYKVSDIVVNIKDKKYHAKLDGNNEIKLAVKARFTPVAILDEENAFVDEYELSINIRDREELIDHSGDNLYIEVFKDSELIKKETLNNGINLITLKNLLINQKYSYKITGIYDQYDGEGEVEDLMLEGNFTTKEPFTISKLSDEETSIEFEFDKLLETVTLNSIKLYDGETLVKDVSTTSNLIEGLTKGTEYTLKFNYEYTHEGSTVEGVQEKTMETFELIYTRVTRNGRDVRHPNGTFVEIPTYKQQDEEIRAIWVSTVGNIDLPKMNGTDVEGYKNTLRLMFDNIKAANLNTVFFQIRPMNDAFYPSDLAPWSRYITGTEGANPGFDLLDFVLNEAHSRDLELHGWLNPYRVSNGPINENAMDPKNFALKYPELVISDSDGKSILDPGEPRVQQYIRDVISEIYTNYPAINGIHFDDYFYLSSFGETSSAPDYTTYQQYKETGQSFADFRRSQVTQIIEDIYNDVETFNTANQTNVRFGISPSGIWANKGESTPDGSDTRGMSHYNSLYADTKLWIEQEIIHYIVPQIYWKMDREVAPYGHLVDWWSDVVAPTNVKLIIGMGPYRYRNGSTSDWTYTNELPEQLRYNQSRSEVSGVSFFTYKDITLRAPQTLVDAMDIVKNEYWTKEATLPWPTNVYD